MTTSIYVGNLSYSADNFSLKALFEQFGEVVSARVMSDRETGRSRGFGFVEMANDDAQRAMSSLDGSEHDGRKLRVNAAEKRASRF